MCGEDYAARGPFRDGLLINCTRLTATRLERVKQTRDVFRQYGQVGKNNRTEGDVTNERSRIETAKEKKRDKR